MLHAIPNKSVIEPGQNRNTDNLDSPVFNTSGFDDHRLGTFVYYKQSSLCQFAKEIGS
jgi:hypothetical protein